MAAQISYKNVKNLVVSSNGIAAISIVEGQGRYGLEPRIWSFAGKASDGTSIRDWKNREEFAVLAEKACRKAGWIKDSKKKCGWRKVGEARNA